MHYVLVAATPAALGKKYYWSRGLDGFTEAELLATQFRNSDDAYTELVDEEITDIAEVRRIG